MALSAGWKFTRSKPEFLIFIFIACGTPLPKSFRSIQNRWRKLRKLSDIPTSKPHKSTCKDSQLKRINIQNPFGTRSKRAINLLPDWEAKMFCDWLRVTPGVKVISRVNFWINGAKALGINGSIITEFVAYTLLHNLGFHGIDNLDIDASVAFADTKYDVFILRFRDGAFLMRDGSQSWFINLSLMHHSIEPTEKYFGVEQNLSAATSNHSGWRISGCKRK